MKRLTFFQKFCGRGAWAIFLVAGVANAWAATNDLNSAVQKGLLEEEANRDLPAAIRAYQSAVTQFDQDRKLAATAIFRLGECYRKQGNMVEAKPYYERIVREFSDQSALVALSRQFVGEPQRTTTMDAIAQKRALEAELQQHEALLEQMKNLSSEELRSALPSLLERPDQHLETLLKDHASAQQKLAEAMANFGENRPEVKQASAVTDLLNQQIDERVMGIVRGTEAKVAALKSRLARLDAQSPRQEPPEKP